MNAKYLKKIQLDDSLTAVYCKKNETEKFYVGYLKILDLNNVTLSLLDSKGNFDGFAVCLPDLIYRIEVGSNYLANLKNKQKNISNIDYPLLNMRDCLEYAKKEKIIVRFYDLDAKTILFGIPISIAEDVITVQRIRTNGQMGRIVELYLKRISMIMYGSNDELNLTKKYLRKKHDQ